MKRALKKIIATALLANAEMFLERKAASWMGKPKKRRSSWFGFHKKKEEDHGIFSKALKYLRLGWRMA